MIWCPKYRRKVLVGEVEARLKEIVLQIASEMNVEYIENQQISERPKQKQKWKNYVANIQI
ncbi:transposase [Campylobacter lanienae]|uniref:transposase n=1 Tax=Campylobacter lanienae TaxID=75658 RepID=UPI000BB3FE5D|nr:transposase [Campylobacter lanienae]